MPPATSPPAWISPDDAEFIQLGISITVASRDVRHVPSLSRALGCRITADGRQLELVMIRPQGETLFRDLEKTGAIAVVFSQPTTHRTLQIKGSDAVIRPGDADDMALARRCGQEFAEEIGKIGFPGHFTQRMFQCDQNDLCVVRFTPADLFQQTPGPNAGARLEIRP